MTSTLRSNGSFVIGSIVVLGMLIALVALGTWQLQRLHWKQQVIADRTAAATAPPVMLTTADLTPQRLAELPDYRRVTLTGSFEHDKEVHLTSQFYDRKTGWHVITPFRLADGGVILVNRGFVPYERIDPASRAEGQVAGTVTISGLIVRPSPPNAFTPGNKAAANMWFWVDIPAIAKSVAEPSLPALLVAADATPNPGGLPIGLDGFQQPRNDHLQYALTWYGLAVLLIAIYLLYSRQKLSEIRRSRS